MFSATVVAATSARDVKEIENRTNLRYRPIIDTVLDFWGEDYWQFSPHGGGHYTDDLMTVSEARRAGRNELPTRWLLHQAQRGRITDLGTYPPYWRNQPSNYARSVLRLDSSERAHLTLQSGGDANWIIISDLRAEDRLALVLLSQSVLRDRVLAVGATTLHSGRKAEHARRLLRQLSWTGVPVLQGSGGRPDSYPEIAAAALEAEFRDDGRGILSPLNEVDARINGLSSLDLQLFITKTLEQAHREEKKINFLVLAPPTDLANALLSAQGRERGHSSAIGQVVMTGGWVSTKDGPRASRSWSMDPVSTQIVLNATNVTLISAPALTSAFNEGRTDMNHLAFTRDLLRSWHPALVDSRRVNLLGRFDQPANILDQFAVPESSAASVAAAAAIVDPSVFSARRSEFSVEVLVDQLMPDGFPVRVGVPRSSFPKHTYVEELDGKKIVAQLTSALRSAEDHSCIAQLSARYATRRRLPNRD